MNFLHKLSILNIEKNDYNIEKYINIMSYLDIENV